MPTDDRAPSTTPPRLDLEVGPLAEALDAIDRAMADIETAKAALVARRHDFARVFREQVQAHADDATLGEDYVAAVRLLYWDRATLRTSDLSAATGLPAERLRQIAGPRLVEEACIACGAPTDVLRTRRSERITPRCPDCRQPDPAPYADAPWPLDAPPPPPFDVPPSADELRSLVGHLEARLATVECDHDLTLARRWAMREGIDVDMVVMSLRRLGAYCDCEVVLNAPPWARSGPPS